MSEWQTIETAPTNKWILLASKNGITCEVGKMSEYDGEIFWNTGKPRMYRYKTFSHLMPLPAPPTP